MEERIVKEVMDKFESKMKEEKEKWEREKAELKMQIADKEKELETVKKARKGISYTSKWF